MMQSGVDWPYPEFFVRLILALALGLLIGLERERAGKEAGLRTFGFTALLGGLGGALGDDFALLTLVLVALLTTFLNIQSLRADQGTELTTSVALLVTCFAGILCGLGHRLTPASVIIVTTALLAWKQPLAGFSKGLSEAEMRSALILAILAIVIYPALPQGVIGPGHLVEPRSAWLTVILIAGIGFVNYVLWKVYGSRGADVAGFLGGLVNSNIVVAELTNRVRKTHGQPADLDAAYRGVLLATAAMLVRNAVLLGILAPAALLSSSPVFILMLLACGAFLLRRTHRNTDQETVAPPDIRLDLPFSLWMVLKYGVIFLILNVLGVLAQRTLGEHGFYIASVIGGIVSSASSVAAAANLETQEGISATIAGIGASIACITSSLTNLLFAARAENRRLTLSLTIAMGSIALVGILTLILRSVLFG